MPPGFKADEALVALAEKCMQTEENIQVVKGMIATGDSFMSDPNRVAAIRDKFEKSLCGRNGSSSCRTSMPPI